MNDLEHDKWARIMLAALVNRVSSFEGGDKFITYGELASQINYPGPHTGSNFGREIGLTLGLMGHLIEKVVVDGITPPLIQAMVVSSGSRLPSDGLKEFNPAYPDLSSTKKRDFTYREYQKIFEFGSRWLKVIEELTIDPVSPARDIGKQSSNKLYNPYGSEGSPEHRALRDYIATHPESVGCPSGQEGIPEYPLKSGDTVDVVFLSEGNILAVEVKSMRSGNDDIERGIYQCIKYFSVLSAEAKTNKTDVDIEIILVIEGNLSSNNRRAAKTLAVKVIENFQYA